MDRKKLKRLYLEYEQKKHPNYPVHAIPQFSYWHSNKKGSRKLIAQIADICEWTSNLMESTENNPVPIIEKFEVSPGFVIDRVVGWRGGTRTKGSSDMKGVIFGEPVYIEIKFGKDRMSEVQLGYKEKVEGRYVRYWIVRTLDEFLYLFNELQKEIEVYPVFKERLKFLQAKQNKL